MRIKEMKGLDDNGCALFLSEFMFLDLYKDNCYEEILKLLKLF